MQVSLKIAYYMVTCEHNIMYNSYIHIQPEGMVRYSMSIQFPVVMDTDAMGRGVW